MRYRKFGVAESDELNKPLINSSTRTYFFVKFVEEANKLCHCALCVKQGIGELSISDCMPSETCWKERQSMTGFADPASPLVSGHTAGWPYLDLEEKKTKAARKERSSNTLDTALQLDCRS